MTKSDNGLIEYENKKQNLGRIVHDILDPTNLTGRKTGFLYEKDYNAMRHALEGLREEGILNLYARSLTGRQSLSEQDEKRINDVLNKHGYGMKSEMLMRIATDWQENSPSLSSSYQPKFMFNIGDRPVCEQFYDSASQKVEEIRQRSPQFGADLDALLKEGTYEDTIMSERWFKNKYEGDERSQMARGFGYAVSKINGLNRDAARIYVERNPFSDADYMQTSEL